MSVRGLGGIGGAALQFKPYRAARSNSVAGRFNRASYCVAASSQGETARDPKMDQKKEKRPPAERDESIAPEDVMTHTFGEGYATRCDEEGFGGIYGGNDTVIDSRHHVNHPEYDKSQGSEVKETEKSRNLKHGAHVSQFQQN